MLLPHVHLKCRQRVGIFCQQYRSQSGGFVSFDGLVSSHSREQATVKTSRTLDGIKQDLKSKFTNGVPLRVPWRHKFPRPYGIDRKLEKLFFAAQQQRNEGRNLRYSGNPESAKQSFEVLSDLLDGGKATPEDLWAQLEEVVRISGLETSSLQTTDEEDAKLKRTILRKLLLQICEVRSQEPFRQSVPSSANIIRIYVKNGFMEYWWEKIFWLQLGILVNWSQALLYKPKTGEVVAHENINRLVGDILEVWEVFMEVHGNRTDPLHAQLFNHDLPNLSTCDSASSAGMSIAQRVSTGWRGLPTDADIKFRTMQAPTENVHRFLHFLPNHPNRRETIKIAEAAILTRDCVRFFAKEHLISEAVVMFAQPFLDLMEHVFQGKKLHVPVAIQCLGERAVSAGTAYVVFRHWSFKSSITGTSSTSRESPQKSRFAHMELEWKQKRYAVISTRIGRAIEKSDPTALTEIWQSFQSMPVLNEPEEPALAVRYLQFLMAGFKLRQPEFATEVWNYMIKSGHQPTRRHWNAMLQGCSKIGDLLSLQGVWISFQSAGFEPDSYAWTTWISGLIRCGEWEQGLQALEKLGEIWKRNIPSEAKPADDFVPLAPSIVTINAVISACQHIRKPEMVQYILQWAESQNVPLETSTFNIMLQPLVLQTDHGEIESLLESMQQHGCAPDIITVSIVLKRLIRSPDSAFSTLSATAQHDAILTILRKMEEQGFPATSKTYSTILDGLLRPDNANIFAAHAVLSHMAAQNLKPSSTIYTILATHYFQQQPPDLAAVEALWKRMRSEGGIRDRYFFDRMIDGYARCDVIEKMFALLRDALAEGKTPSWIALTAMLHALHRAREWALAMELVADVLDEKTGVLRHGEFERTGKGHFWALVDSLVYDGFIRLPSKPDLSGKKEMPGTKSKARGSVPKTESQENE